ncbi:hypothetical protein JHK84_050797 [Glycine max]|nr:hypothetical protein JHK84_050797 [Glycine max]
MAPRDSFLEHLVSEGSQDVQSLVDLCSVSRIFGAKIVLGAHPAPRVAAFSSKGPNALNPEILKIPQHGIFENVNSLDELAKMLQWTKEKPLRVATGFTYLGHKFMKENGFKHVTFSTADGALEAAPAVRDSKHKRTTLTSEAWKETPINHLMKERTDFLNLECRISESERLNSTRVDTNSFLLLDSSARSFFCLLTSLSLSAAMPVPRTGIGFSGVL